MTPRPQQSFDAYARVRGFVGQEHILKELNQYALSMIAGNNYNLLFVANSGHGKTTLAKMFISYIDPSFKESLMYIPRKKGEIYLEENKRIHLIDEAHLLKNPESLYSKFDSEQHSILLATNFYDQLIEPLYNRCDTLLFTSYSDEELAWIIYNEFKRKSRDVPIDWAIQLVGYTRGNPRIARKLVNRINLMINHFGEPDTVEILHDYITKTLKTGKGGFTLHDNNYIKALNKCNGVASLATLVGITKIPQRIIMEEIEPFLIMRGIIRKTSKGRQLCQKS